MTATESTAPATRWRDRKRYLWIAGLLVPVLPFAAGRWVEQTGWNALWYAGPIWILVIMPLLDTVFGTDASNPPDWAIPQLESDRFYRWITYLYLPLQYYGFLWAAAIVAGGTLSPLSELGLALTVGLVAGIGINTAHELGHKRDKLERRLSNGRPLGSPSWNGVVAGGRRPAPQGPAGVVVAQRRPQRLGPHRGPVRRDDRLLRRAGDPVHRRAGRVRVLAARGRQLHRALRAAAPDAAQRTLRALPARAQLEQQQRGLQPAAVPPGTPLRSPRQPHPPLPIAAPLRRGAPAAVGLRADDGAGLGAAAVAPGHGPPRRRPLRRRCDPGRRDRILAGH